jgi:hypothetical protein
MAAWLGQASTKTLSFPAFFSTDLEPLHQRLHLFHHHRAAGPAALPQQLQHSRHSTANVKSAYSGSTREMVRGAALRLVALGRRLAAVFPFSFTSSTAASSSACRHLNLHPFHFRVFVIGHRPSALKSLF